MTTLVDDEKIITKIIHIADIHIYLKEYHEEYNLVFKKLYKKIREIKRIFPNILLVIAGDVFQSKGKSNAIMNAFAGKFFKKLSAILPVIIIAGNHDCYEDRHNDIDSITALLIDGCYDNSSDEDMDMDEIQKFKQKAYPDIYYLRDSGIYKYNNIIFGVSSIIDKHMLTKKEIDDYIIENNILLSHHTTYIGLYHGLVRSQYTPKMIKSIENNKTPNISTFDGYDIVMLGDIHLHYYLDDKKHIAYASSLISHSFSETDEDHGYILWDVASGESEYVRIPNEHAYKIHKYDEYITDELFKLSISTSTSTSTLSSIFSFIYKCVVSSFFFSVVITTFG
jgi:DNA repair exonuclease SbcCD nuclease subunit